MLLENCANLKDAALTSLFAGCPSLRKLRLTNCLSMCSPRLRNAAVHSVELLNCQSLGDHPVLEMLQHCPALRAVKISGSCRSSYGSCQAGGEMPAASGTATVASGVCTAVNGTTPAASSSALRKLEIACTSWSDSTLDCLMAQTDNTLATVCLSDCQSLVSPRLVGASLGSVTVSDCANLVDAAVSCLFQCALQLSEVRLARCNALLSPQMVSLSVQSVSIHDCANICDLPVVQLVHSRSLLWAELFDCPCTKCWWVTLPSAMSWERVTPTRSRVRRLGASS